MSRWYAFLGAVLIAGAVVSVVFGAWPLAVVLLVVGGGGLLTEIRQRRRSSAAIDVPGREFAANESTKGQVVAMQQQQEAQGWGAGASGSYGG